MRFIRIILFLVIVSVVHHRRLSGHVILMEKTHPIHCVYKGVFAEGNQTSSRPKNSWKETVERTARANGINCR